MISFCVKIVDIKGMAIFRFNKNDTYVGLIVGDRENIALPKEFTIEDVKGIMDSDGPTVIEKDVAET